VRGEELEEAGFLKLNVFWKGLAAVGLQLVGTPAGPTTLG